MREKHLYDLEVFEKDASDPNRFFQKSIYNKYDRKQIFLKNM